MIVALKIPNPRWPRRHADRNGRMLARIYFDAVEMFTAGRIRPCSAGVTHERGLASLTDYEVFLDAVDHHLRRPVAHPLAVRFHPVGYFLS